MITRAKKYLTIKADPALATLKFLESTEQMAEKMARRAVEDILAQLVEEFKQKIEILARQLSNSIPEISKQIASNGIQKFIEQNGFMFKGLKGDSYILTEQDRQQIAKSIEVPIVEKIETIVEKPIFTEVIKEKALKDEPEEIAKKLNTLQESIQIDVIDGLQKELANLRKNIKSVKGAKSGSGDIVQYYDLSSSCNGILKTFTIPSNRKVIGVWGSDVPGGNYRPVVDWTGTGTTTLTLTSAVAEPTTGATLFLIYVK